MAEFDPTLDATLWEKESPSGFILTIKSYNGGEPKLALSRKMTYRGETNVKHMGRVSRDELSFLYDSMKEIAANLVKR